MDIIQVSSSMIGSVGYDQSNKLLEVEFSSNSVYQYFNVPVIIYNDLISAPSKGKYFTAFIKYKFQYHQLR